MEELFKKALTRIRLRVFRKKLERKYLNDVSGGVQGTVRSFTGTHSGIPFPVLGGFYIIKCETEKVTAITKGYLFY